MPSLPKSGHSRTSVPTSSAKKPRLAASVAVGSVSAVVIVLGLAWMIPTKEADKTLGDQTALSPMADAVAPSREIQTTSVGTVEKELSPITHPIGAGRQSSLTLPTEAKPAETAVLLEELKALAEELPRDYPDDAGSFHLAAQAYSELKQSEKAEQLWHQCIVKSIKHMGPYVGLASMLMEKGRNEDAIKLLKQAQDLGGSSPEMLLKLGEAYENMGELQQALECSEAGTLAYAEVPELWFLRGRVQNQLGQVAEAESHLRKAIELGGNQESILPSLISSLVRQKKLAEAADSRETLAQLKKPKEFEKDTFQDRYNLALTRILSDILVSAGALAESHQDFVSAEKFCQRACELNPGSVEAYREWLTVCRRLQRAADQKVLLKKLIELQPQDVVNYSNLASLALQSGDPGLAELTLKRALDFDRDGILIRAALAKLYLATGNLVDARQFAAEVVERQPSSAAYRLLAATYQSSGLEAAYKAANQRADELAKAAPNADTP